jgi:general secretion pathway protein D
MISCGNGVPGGTDCIPTKKDVKAAHQAYERGIKLEEHKNLEQAFQAFDQASKLVPDNLQFFNAREVAKSQIVFEHTARADTLASNAHQQAAVAEYRAALKIDPDNSYIQNRLIEAQHIDAPLPTTKGIPQLVSDSGELHLQPREELATFHYTGDVKTLFTQLATAYGLNVEFDDSVQTKQVRFNVDDVDFFTALNLACRVSKTMWTPLDSNQFLLASDTTENHKQFDRVSLATFIVPGASTPQEATEMVTSLRNICDFQKINTGQSGVIEVRAPQAVLEACTQLLHQLTSERPQVALDIHIYQISSSFARDIGLHIPDTFNLFNIPEAALAALGGQSIQQLVNQLVSGGGINQAGNSSISALLSQLQNQQNGIFANPLATFGGGLTFSGLSLDHFTMALSLNESWSRSISDATLLTGQGKEATFHLGERYPIINASFAPVFNSSQISQVLGNQSFVPPVPSVSYEDLGLNLKATTAIHANDEISMKLDLELRSLTGASANGVPVIANQQYQGGIRLRDGETAVVAGEITTNDQYAIAGIPGVAAIPGINQVLEDNNKQNQYDELLITLTPHITAKSNHATDEIWVTQK